MMGSVSTVNLLIESRPKKQEVRTGSGTDGERSADLGDEVALED